MFQDVEKKAVKDLENMGKIVKWSRESTQGIKYLMNWSFREREEKKEDWWGSENHKH